VLALIIPISVFLGITAPEIAVLLFGNGVAGADAARVAGEVVTFFAVGIPAFSLIYVLFRAWYAMEDTRTPFWFAVIINVINLAIAVPLFNAAAVQDKVAMLAAAYSIAYTIATVLAWWWLGRSVAGLEAGRTLLLAIKVGAAAGVAGAAMWWLTSVFTLTSPLSLMFGLTALWLIGGVIFLGLASVLRVHEVNSVLGMVRAKLRK
jgi:putative peptidoglycan lipid II flippase